MPTASLAAMQTFTVFYSHPCLGSGSYEIQRATAEIAGKEAADTLPDNMSEDEAPTPEEGEDAMSEYETNLSIILDDLDIEVYAGTHAVKPGQAPDYVFE